MHLRTLCVSLIVLNLAPTPVSAEETGVRFVCPSNPYKDKSVTREKGSRFQYKLPGYLKNSTKLNLAPTPVSAEETGARFVCPSNPYKDKSVTREKGSRFQYKLPSYLKNSTKLKALSKSSLK